MELANYRDIMIRIMRLYTSPQMLAITRIKGHKFSNRRFPTGDLCAWLHNQCDYVPRRPSSGPLLVRSPLCVLLFPVSFSVCLFQRL